METTKRPNLAIETYILLGICLLDLVSTVWLIVTNQAIEGNPIMAFYVEHGLWVLVVAKIMIAVAALFVAEWGRRHRPRFVHRVLRIAIVAYVGMYVLAFVSSGIRASEWNPEACAEPPVQQDFGGSDWRY